MSLHSLEIAFQLGMFQQRIENLEAEVEELKRDRGGPVQSVMPKIYLYCYEAQVDGVAARAVTEDGATITGVVSSTEAWAKHDLGYTSEHQHALYHMRFPQGYELVWGRPPS